MSVIYILHGPNLNLLGTREPEIYGSATLEQWQAACEAVAAEQQVAIVWRQSNQEGELVDWIQEAGQKASGLILNAAAYTHSSVALRDAVSALTIPTIEVHLSNIYAREDFRHHSYLSPVVKGVICGLGGEGYVLALRALLDSTKT